MLPITFVSPLFRDDWVIVIGIFNILIRLGSVSNFLISPVMYSSFGISSAFWLAAVIGCSSVFLALTAIALAKAIKIGKSEERSIEYNLSPTSEHGVEMISSDKEIIKETINDVAVESEVSDSYFTRFLKLPYFHFSRSFYFYMLSGSLLYGSVVPFWFIGSKYLQEHLFLSVYVADALMGIPDFMIILICLPLGLVVKQCRCSLRTQLTGLAVSTLGMGLSFMSLITAALFAYRNSTYSLSSDYSAADTVYRGSVGLLETSLQSGNSTSASSSSSQGAENRNIASGALSMIFLGISFAFGYSFFWGVITKMVPEVLQLCFYYTL